MEKQVRGNVHRTDNLLDTFLVLFPNTTLSLLLFHLTQDKSRKLQPSELSSVSCKMSLVCFLAGPTFQCVCVTHMCGNRTTLGIIPWAPFTYFSSLLPFFPQTRCLSSGLNSPSRLSWPGTVARIHLPPPHW